MSWTLGRLVRMPYLEAKAELMECPGIGSKIADCIAVFSLEKLEAFPIDVWVRRALGSGTFLTRKPLQTGYCWSGPKTISAATAATPNSTCFHGRRLGR